LKETGSDTLDESVVRGIAYFPRGGTVDPPLTTIALPMYDLGATGMEALIKLRRGEITLDDNVVLPHRLVVRKSTAPLRQKERSALR